MTTGRAAWLIGATVLAVAVAWAGAAELPTPARSAVVALVALLPALLLAQAFVDDDEVAALSVIPVYVSSIAMILLIGAGAAWAGLASGMTRASLGLREVDAVEGVIWTGAVVLVAIGVAVAGRLLGHRESPMLERLLPRTNAQRAVFVLLSVSAGVGEELAFRGFLIPALETASGSTRLAVIVSSVAFGMLHSYQRSDGVIRASALGVVLAAPLLATGSIYPSMAAHALYDLVVGLLLADWLVGRDGGAPAGPK